MYEVTFSSFTGGKPPRILPLSDVSDKGTERALNGDQHYIDQSNYTKLPCHTQLRAILLEFCRLPTS